MRNKNKIIAIVAVAVIAAVAVMAYLVLFGPLGRWMSPSIPPDDPEATTDGMPGYPDYTGYVPQTGGEGLAPPVQPGEEDPNLRFGITQYESGQYAQAIGTLNQVLAGNPSSVEAYTYRGLSNFMLEKYHDAITDFTNALRNAPGKGADIVALRGGSYYRAGYYPEAIRDLSDAIASEPNNKTAYTYRARTYEAMGQHALASADYQMAEALGGMAQ